MANRLRLGLVGAGTVVERYHLPAVRAVPEVLPWIVADSDPHRAAVIARKASFRHTVSHYQELVGQVDLAIVALPNSMHAPISCALLNAGIHVLCEKPMARTIKECEDMIEAASAGNAVLAVGHNRRFRANVREAKYILSKGMIGELVNITSEEGSRFDWPRSKSYFDPAVAGGGSLLDVGIHGIDLIRYLAGEFDSIIYCGDQTETTVENEAELRFRLTCGTHGELRCSRIRELSNRLRFEGTDGCLTIGLWGPSIHLYRKHGKAFRHFSELALSSVRRAMDGSFVDQLFSFVGAIRGERDNECSGISGLGAVEVVQWAYEGVRPPRRLLSVKSTTGSN